LINLDQKLKHEPHKSLSTLIDLAHVINGNKKPQHRCYISIICSPMCSWKWLRSSQGHARDDDDECEIKNLNQPHFGTSWHNWMNLVKWQIRQSLISI